MEIRKIVTFVEEIHEDGGKPVVPPARKAAVAAVIKNPYAGRFAESLDELIETGGKLSEILSKKAVEALGIEPAKVESFGKAAIVGSRGELEHAAALLHPKLGAPLRSLIGGGKAIIPSAKKLGAAGASIDVPLHYKDAAMVRSHFDAIEVRVPDAPRDDEIVVAIAVTDAGRPHPRVGGLKKEEATKGDGLR